MFWLASAASSSRRLAAPFFARRRIPKQRMFCHNFSHQRLRYTKIACSPTVEVTERRERVSIFIQINRSWNFGSYCLGLRILTKFFSFIFIFNSRWHPVDLLFQSKKYELTTIVNRTFDEFRSIAIERIFLQTIRKLPSTLQRFWWMLRVTCWSETVWRTP